MEILQELTALRRSIDVLQHPFYERWNAGTLDDVELARYAGEYRHAAAALARASQLAADEAPERHAAALAEHAREEALHVALWDAFAREARSRAPVGDDTGARAVDGAAAGDPAPETAACVRAWTAGEDLIEHLAVLYVLEGAQPAISRTKLDGLVRHYGYRDEGPATEYFRVHELLDVEHSERAGELILELRGERCPGGEDGERRLLDRATAALRGNWLLLDGVEAARSS